MCGFIGLQSDKQKYRQNFEKGLCAIIDRGITVDTYATPAELYGYSRLPTDDTENESLHKITDSDGCVLLFNGLITNTEHLATKYSLGAAVARSDYACLRAGLLQYGTDFLQHCRGMFACAFIQDDQVLLARDTVGIKPLYYMYHDGFFAFASEIKALKPLADAPIHEVLPGQIIRYSKATTKLTKEYFTYKSYAAYTPQNIEQCLTDTVVEPTRRYLDNAKDKKVAILLSGGLDSSIVAQLLANHLSADHRQRLVGFCIGEPSAPDMQNAQKLAKHLRLTLVCLHPMGSREVLKQLDEIVFKVESPLARVIKVSLLYDVIAKAIEKRGIHVVVGGEGADELFFGYHRFIDGLELAQSEKLFENFRQNVFYYTLLQRYERIFARRRIEGRVPYLDQELIEMAKVILPQDKIRHTANGHVSKLPLRSLAKQIGLPAYICDRPKEKMTSGATGQDNESSASGYLEKEIRDLTGITFQEIVAVLYKRHFHTEDTDVLLHDDGLTTEEDLMEQVRNYKQGTMRASTERNTL